MTDAPIPILFRSPALVAVNKPAGLAVHRGRSRDAQHALDLVRDQIGAYLYPVHRLDRATSGVLVFALTQDAARELALGFAERRVEKRYLALVRGKPPDWMRVEHPLSNADDGAPRPATTIVRSLARYDRYALVEAVPETGRTHQVRRHLKHLSCPIIGDVRHGKGIHNRWFRDVYSFRRMALHASRLTLTHPASGERVTFEAPLPSELADLLSRLEEETRTGGALGPDDRRAAKPAS